MPDAASGPISTPSARGWIAFAIKAAISAAILGFAATQIDRAALFAAAGALQYGPLAAALIVLALAILIAAARWSFLTRRAAPIGLGEATAVSFAAQFLGQVLPSSLGQDAVRVWFVRRPERSLADIVAVVFLDRLCGMIGLCLLILIAAPHLLAQGLGASGREAALAAFAIAGAGIAGAAALRFLPTPRSAPRPLARLVDAARKAGEILTSRDGLFAVILSIGMQSLVVICVWLIAAGAGARLGIADAFAAVPAAMLVALLPISVNGWGVREGAMIAGLGLFGVAAPQAFLVSVLYGGLLFASSLPGALMLPALGTRKGERIWMSRRTPR